MNTTKKKLLVFSSSLAGGGAEKHLLRLLPYFQNNFEVSLALSRKEGEFLQELPGNLTLLELGKGRVLKALIPLALYLKRERPDLLFSIQDHTNAIAILAHGLSFQSKTKVICSIQNNISESKKTARSLSAKALYLSAPRLYSFAEQIITCSEGLKEDLLSYNHKLKTKTKTIYNAALEDSLFSKKDEPCDDSWLNDSSLPVIISCGRLVPQKNHDLLVRAFSRVLTKTPSRLIIMGNGPEENKLKKLVGELNLAAKVRFIPFNLNHYKYITRATLFVLSSSWEGFGNVLVEAMSCGTAVVSTNCPYGPSEIIEDNKNGLLVEKNNEFALAQAILLLLENKELRQRLAEEGRRCSFEFSAEKIAAQHLELFNSLLCQK